MYSFRQEDLIAGPFEDFFIPAAICAGIGIGNSIFFIMQQSKSQLVPYLGMFMGGYQVLYIVAQFYALGRLLPWNVVWLMLGVAQFIVSIQLLTAQRLDKWWECNATSSKVKE
jgi:hypothetical protein